MLKINIINAYANNLKNISLSIPLNKITGITGISGSGKSSLLKNVIASLGALNFSRLKTKTIQKSLLVEDFIDVDDIENLPQTLFIDVVNHVMNTSSTLSTISGIHELLRSIFYETAETFCQNCGNLVSSEALLLKQSIELYSIDVPYDNNYSYKKELIMSLGKIIREEFYDYMGQLITTKKERRFSTINLLPFEISEHKFIEISRRLGVKILVKVIGINTLIDPLSYTVCFKCHNILPLLKKSRLSFNVDYDSSGGACRYCEGTGRELNIVLTSIVADKYKSILEGGINFVSDTGIKYTTVTEAFILAFCQKHGIRVDVPVGELTSDEMQLLLLGSETPVSFRDRVGGHKTENFRGIVTYLIKSFRKGKGSAALKPFISEKICHHCNGIRIDPSIDSFRLLDGAVLRDLLKMTLNELRDWCRSYRSNKIGNLTLNYIQKIEAKLDLYDKVSCSHLQLSRGSSSLSGGELQRIRMCSMMSANIKNICYLFDEPSSGLHYDDIEKLIELFKEMCYMENTVIIVEHNKKLLAACDYLVELGNGGGINGGKVIIADYIENIANYQTPTSTYLCDNLCTVGHSQSNKTDSIFAEMMEFENISINNLKKLKVAIPYNAFTTVCGVSGSGKSSLIKWVFDTVSSNINKYNFSNVIYLGQAGIKSNSSTDVCSLLCISECLAEIFEKNTGGKKELFLPTKEAGKCRFCRGKGFLVSNSGEQIGICSSCEGRGYTEDALYFRYKNMTIYDVRNTAVSQLQNMLDNNKISNICSACSRLGVGYVTLSRGTGTLSKGEYQRVVLARLIANLKNKTLCILDEPSKGLHNDDIIKLVELIRHFTVNGNTVIAVEHDPTAIYESDHTLELGGTSINGGEIIYQGNPKHINKTPTAQAIFGKIFQTNGSHKLQNFNPKKTYSVGSDEQRIELKRFSINRLSSDSDILLFAYKKTNELFLDAATRGSSSISGDISINKLELDVPMMFLVDFAGDRTRIHTSVYNALGISRLLIKEFSNEYPKETDILRYVINDKSHVGKCSSCHGKGHIYTLPEELFVDGKDLSNHVVKFIRNSTNFRTVKDSIKKITGINIGKKLSLMSPKEKLFLFHGYYDSGYDGEIWRGIIELAILNSKYYPDKELAESFDIKKSIVTCNWCSGKLLEGKFIDYTCCGLTFADWLTTPIKKLLSILSYFHNREFIKKILETLNILHNFKIDEKIRLIDNLNELPNVFQGIIDFTSLFVNNIHDTVIIIKNISYLSQFQVKIVEDLSMVWSRTNTIVILD